MRFFVLYIFLVLGVSSKSQDWGVSTECQWSYSGAHWVNGASWNPGKFEVGLAHRLALQQSRFPWDGGQGISAYSRFFPDEFGFVQVQYNLNFPNREDVVLQEGFLGFGMKKDFYQRWRFSGSFGLGTYLEKSSSSIRYTKRGISHCTSFGLSYRFF